MDHKRDGSAIPKYEKYYKTNQGTKRQLLTTIGWKFLVNGRNGSK